jgi:hypothetical protein
MSPLTADYYGDDALNNLGFGFTDLDNDGDWELVIGSIKDAETNPLVFEIWSLVDGKPVMVAQSDSENQYFLQYSADENAWFVACETQKSDKQHSVHYLVLSEDTFDVMQAIVYDEVFSPDAPWFMAYDQDMDASNDEAISAEDADAVMSAQRRLYMAVDYFPYSLYH